MIKSERIWALAGLSLVATACNQKGKEPDNQPEAKPKTNIIYILADDLGYSDIGSYGQKLIKTPNLDRMAAEGMVFTQHYAGTSVSAPSRCVLMTGMHTGHAVVRGNKQVEPYGQMQLPDSTVTVAELLKQAGYVTGMFGKWGLGVENTAGDPNRQGFDLFYGYYCQVLAHNAFPEFLFRNGQKEMLSNVVTYLDTSHWTKGLGSYATEQKEYSNDLFFNDILKFVEQNKDTSFFVYFPTIIPHNNGEAPAGFMNESPTLEPYTNENWTREQKAYAASVTRLDSYVGQLMGKLKELGIDKNTLVIFTSDNGPEFTEIFEGNAPFKGKKRDLYEGGLREPMIAWWPGSIKPGSKTDYISAFWDFLPTACEIAGVQPPAGIDGISYLPTLLGKEQPQHDYLYWEFHEQGGKQAVRKGQWKAVRTGLNQNPDAPVELYNLTDDIGETKNVATEYPDIAAQMLEIMKKEHRPDPEWPLLGKQ